MSVINQVLLNLEKRGANFADLEVLPEHVQLPSENARARNWGWVAAGIAFLIAAPTGWIAFKAMVAEPTRSPAASGAGGERLAARPDELERAHFQETRAFRLSFELSNLPDEPALGDMGAPKVAAKAKKPLSSARVISRAKAESALAAARAAPSRRRAEVAPGPTRAAAPGPRMATAKAVLVTPAVKDVAAQPEIRKQVRDPTPRELADHEYRKAVALLDQERPAEAETGLRKALNVYPEHHQARQVLVGLLVQNRRLVEAERVLEGGVKLAPAQTGFNLTLARLQGHRGDRAQAIATLKNGLKYAHGSAEYAAYLATLLQREGKHDEAIEHFRKALRLRPNFGVWWVGLGVSLQATNEPAAALDAYRRARAAGNLHPHVAALAEQRLRQLQ